MTKNSIEAPTRHKERKAPTLSRYLILLVDMVVGVVAAVASLLAFYTVTELVTFTPQILATIAIAGLISTFLSSWLATTGFHWAMVVRCF